MTSGSETPSKCKCDYCDQNGYYTFADGETFCLDCFNKFPIDARQCRRELAAAQAQLAALEEKRREDVRKCAAVAEGDYLAVNPYTGGRKDAAVMIRNAFPEVFP